MGTVGPAAAVGSDVGEDKNDAMPPFLYTILYDQPSPLDTVAGSFGQKRSLGLGCLPGATLVLKGLQAESGRLLCPTLSGTHSANKPGS